jgi:hypothetical protein
VFHTVGLTQSPLARTATPIKRGIKESELMWQIRLAKVLSFNVGWNI